MNTRVFTLMFAVALAGTRCLAQTININYEGGGIASAPNILGLDGQPLANGNDVQIGYFDASVNLTDFASLQAAYQSGAWHAFGSTTIQSDFSPIGTFPGSFSSTASSTSTAQANQFNGHQIDLWIFETPGAALPASDLSNVSAYGLFTSTVNTASDTWIFTATLTPSTDSISTADVSGNTIIHGSSVAGSPGSLEVGAVAVPEPSTMSLFGFGLASAAWVARRRIKAG